MDTQLELLRKYIRLNYKNQDEFATAIDLTRQGLSYIIRTSKSNREQLKPDFIKRLERNGIDINILQRQPTNDHYEKIKIPVDMKSTDLTEKDKLIKSLESHIITQKEFIQKLVDENDYLKSKVQEYEIKANGTTKRRSA